MTLVRVRSVAALVLQAALLLVILAAFFIRTPQVSGLSMAPHIATGEFVLINTLAYRFGTPARGDIVAFEHQGDSPELYIKRVVALPGDVVRVESGTVIVNGKTLDEPYVAFKDARSFPEMHVGPHSVYVLGDNRANSEDSRFFGTVDDSALLGRALLALWPPPAFGILR